MCGGPLAAADAHEARTFTGFTEDAGPIVRRAVCIACGRHGTRGFGCNFPNPAAGDRSAIWVVDGGPVAIIVLAIGGPDGFDTLLG